MSMSPLEDEAMPKHSNLRQPGLDDVDVLLKIGEMAKKASTGTGFTEDRREKQRKKIADAVTKPQTQEDVPNKEEYLVITNDEGEAVGALSYTRDPRSVQEKYTASGCVYTDLDENGNRWHMNGSGILPEYRRGGTWKKAMLQVEQLAADAGVKYITTDMGTDNEGIIAARKSMGYEMFKDPDAEELGYKAGTKLMAVKRLNDLD